MNNPKILVLVTILIWSFGGTAGRFISIESEYLLLAITFLLTLILAPPKKPTLKPSRLAEDEK